MKVSTFGYPSTEWTTTYLQSLNANGQNPGLAIKTGRYGAGAFPVMTMLMVVASAALIMQAVSLFHEGRRERSKNGTSMLMSASFDVLHCTLPHLFDSHVFGATYAHFLTRSHTCLRRRFRTRRMTLFLVLMTKRFRFYRIDAAICLSTLFKSCVSLEISALMPFSQRFPSPLSSASCRNSARC